MSRNIDSLLEHLTEKKEEIPEVENTEPQLHVGDNYPFGANKRFYINEFVVDTMSTNRLIYIGNSFVPKELRRQCIVLSEHYDWEVTTIDGRTVLIPKRK